nr:hypothetical protein Iba_chr09aCG3100 [Ipomoea batatas]
MLFLSNLLDKPLPPTAHGVTAHRRQPSGPSLTVTGLRQGAPYYSVLTVDNTAQPHNTVDNTALRPLPPTAVSLPAAGHRSPDSPPSRCLLLVSSPTAHRRRPEIEKVKDILQCICAETRVSSIATSFKSSHVQSVVGVCDICINAKRSFPFDDDLDVFIHLVAKTEKKKYPTLSQIAKDLIAIPQFYVPSESAFKYCA